METNQNVKITDFLARMFAPLRNPWLVGTILILTIVMGLLLTFSDPAKVRSRLGLSAVATSQQK